MADKRILLVNRSAPYGSAAAKESLDIALTCGVFEQQVQILFVDDGVYQLLKGQSPNELEQKSLEANLAALPLYDVDELYACSASALARKIDTHQISEQASLIDETQVQQLIKDADVVLTF